MALTTATMSLTSDVRARAEQATRHYRPDIDGLRAIAVVLVILFHAVPSIFPGGFVGVDAFFVISGYLITSIIWRETREGSFTLSHFYARRCRRILPALFVVLVAVWTIGRVILTADDFRVVAKHVAGGATFTSNILLWQETGYFDIAGVRKPLLHLWSLGVEEQFYAVWPPLVMFAVARRWRLGHVTAAVVAGSAALAIALAPAHADLVFYMLPTRMWELLTGGLLVVWRDDRDLAPHSRTASNILAFTGMILVVVAGFVEPPLGRARIAWLALPVSGTAMLIAANGAWINRLLSRRVLVTIGLVSYPLYLWHWPLLSMTSLLNEQAPRVQMSLLRLAVVAASFALAWCTWRFVELPVRRSAASPPANIAARNRQVLVVSGVLLAVVGAAGWRGMAASPSAADASLNESEVLLDGDSVFKGAAYHRYSGAARVVLLVGDSHSSHFVDGLRPHARARGFGISHIGLGGCLGVPLARRLWGTAELFARCQSLAEATYPRFLRDPAVKVVVFAARGELYAEGTEAGIVVAREHHTELPADERRRVLHDAYAGAIRSAEDAGKRVVLVLDIPELDYDPEYCGTDDAASPSRCAMERRRVDERQNGYRAVVGMLQHEDPRLAVFDPVPLLCDAAWCYTKRNGVLLYKGDNHLSVDGSRIVADRLADIVFANEQK